MKRKLMTLVLSLFLLLGSLTPASAWYIEVDNADGDNTFEFWFRTEGESIALQYYDIMIGYDTDELAFSGDYTVNLPSDWTLSKDLYNRESDVLYMCPTGFQAPALTEDFLFATITFDVLSEATIDGENDIWWYSISGYGIGIDWSSYSLSDMILSGQAVTGAGLDVGAAVPIPSGVLLLGSGLAGLIGLRRREGRKA